MAAIVGVTAFSIKDVKAAPSTYVSSFPETITRKKGNDLYRFTQGISITDTEQANNVIRYIDTTDTYYLFCSDRTNAIVGTDTDDVLTKDKKMDYKIAYLLKNAYPNKAFVAGSTTDFANDMADEMANVWITQVALWGVQGTITQNDMTAKLLTYGPASDRSLSYTYNENN